MRGRTISSLYNNSIFYHQKVFINNIINNDILIVLYKIIVLKKSTCNITYKIAIFVPKRIGI